MSMQWVYDWTIDQFYIAQACIHAFYLYKNWNWSPPAQCAVYWIHKATYKYTHPAAIQRHDAIKLFIDYHLIIPIHFTWTFVRKVDDHQAQAGCDAAESIALLSLQHILFVNELKIEKYIVKSGRICHSAHFVCVDRFFWSSVFSLVLVRFFYF